MKIKILLIFLSISTLNFSQIPEIFAPGCATHLPEILTPSSSPTDCENFNILSRAFDDLFIPQSSSTITIIKVNLIFVQRNDGTGNFQENNTEHQSIIDGWINIINERFSSINNSRDPNCNPNPHYFISDSRIRFEFNKIYIRDSYGWNNSGGNTCPEYPNWYLNYLDEQIINNPSYTRGINIYFTEDKTNYLNLVENQTTTEYNGNGLACSQFPITNDFTASSRIHVPDRYSKYWWMKNICPSLYPDNTWDPDIKNWLIQGEGVGIAHEIGHSLNLFHECPGYYVANGCDNALMSQCGTCLRQFVPPTELGRMHAAIALTNVRTFAIQNYNPIPIQISSARHFNIRVNLLQSIEIVSGGYLTISCDLKIHPQAEVRVKSGGMCIMNESTINSDGTSFKGIVVENGAYLELKSYAMNNQSIEIESGGTLRISEELFLSGRSKIDIKQGAYICIENGTSIELQEPLDVINLHNGYISGVNTNVVPNPGNCIVNPVNISIIGSGSINTYSEDIYLQDMTFTEDNYVTGRYIYVGKAVTQSLPTGNVYVNSGIEVILDADIDVIVDDGFEIRSGGIFEIH
ncbi:MAG: hypothetical protein JXA77_05590 [Bacteroidales bacterium]|nr:hypothetical protein [Bacteroidales bacterium]